jgi:hypothetical protein
MCWAFVTLSEISKWRYSHTKADFINTMTRYSTIYEGVSKGFRTKSLTKYMLTTINTRWEPTQRVMAAKLTRLTHKIAIQRHLVAEPFAVLAPGGQSGNFWTHPRTVLCASGQPSSNKHRGEYQGKAWLSFTCKTNGVVPYFRWISTTPWRRMAEWRYSLELDGSEFSPSRPVRFTPVPIE